MTIHTELWRWPQYCILAGYATTLVMYYFSDGKTLMVKPKFASHLLFVLLWLFVLYKGGFF